jgi:hypothetical protein
MLQAPGSKWHWHQYMTIFTAALAMIGLPYAIFPSRGQAQLFDKGHCNHATPIIPSNKHCSDKRADGEAKGKKRSFVVIRRNGGNESEASQEIWFSSMS